FSFYGSELTPHLIGSFDRLALSKGEGRVRVAASVTRIVSEPLTSILSPCSKGRGGCKRAGSIRAFIREMICNALAKFLVQVTGIARVFFCRLESALIPGGIGLRELEIRDDAAP